MSGPDITAAEIERVTAVLRSGCLSLGPQAEEFERCVAAFSGAKHAVAVSSGTAGLHLAVIASGVREGDLVITTPFSFVASANSVLYERAIPVFVDVDPITRNIDPTRVFEAVRDLRSGGERRRRWLPPAMRDVIRADADVKAILPIHAFGQPADMDPIADIASANDLRVIEDACEAFGATYKGRQAGTIGDVGVYAFYPNKQLTTGEGGIVVTDDDDLAFHFKSMRNQGRDTMSAWLQHDRLGYNYRMSELNAALGVAQLSRVDDLLGARDRVARWYFDRLRGIPGVTVPHVVSSTTRMSWFAYVVRLAPELGRQQLMDRLAAHGIPSRTYFSPIHLQPFYRQQFGYSHGDYPVTEALGESCLALPFSGVLTEQQVDRVCNTLATFVGASQSV